MRINIMTSCDNNLAMYILVQLASIQSNLEKYDVHFYLLHSRVSPENINMLNAFTQNCSAITFHEIMVKDTKPYEILASYGGSWPFETYFSLGSEHHLPQDVDRILYIDAGDVVVHNDISEFYFANFEDKSIIAATAWVQHSGELMTDMEAHSTRITKGMMSSGAYVMNMDKIRGENTPVQGYVGLAEGLLRAYPNRKPAYYGDQGLVSYVFLGKIKLIADTEFKRNENYKMVSSKYHVCSEFVLLDPNYPFQQAAMLHFGGPVLKPWNAWFKPEVVKEYGDNFSEKYYKNMKDYAPFNMNWRQCQMAEIWWHYCTKTPVFTNLAMYGRATGAALENFYLPLCKRFNDMVDANK